ncbi:hypothetical protein [Streptomyces sp. NPDC048641]|uniref:hypothetical protein n=1 Tax=unclassified Streptomyces TaxID=2593676 RepID=UPI00342A4C88
MVGQELIEAENGKGYQVSKDEIIASAKKTAPKKAAMSGRRRSACTARRSIMAAKQTVYHSNRPANGLRTRE